MFIHLYEHEVKGEAAPGACPRCKGLGVEPGGRESDPGPCTLCDGFGRLRLVERPAPGPAPRYLVTVGDGLVETGNELAGLVRQVCRDWADSPDDICVFHDRGGDGFGGANAGAGKGPSKASPATTFGPGNPAAAGVSRLS